MDKDLSGAKVVMNCSKCIFATCSPPMSGGPFGIMQTGCKTGRLNKYIEYETAEIPQLALSSQQQGDEASNFYQLKTFCNLNRDYPWVRKIKKQEATNEELIDIAREEVKSSFGIVIQISTESEKDLKKTIESIKNVSAEYDVSKITVIISVVEKNLHTQIYANLVEEVKAIGMGCLLVIHYEHADMFVIDTDAMRQIFKDKRSYICKLRAGQTLVPQIMSYIDTVVNDDLDKVVVFEERLNQNVFVNTKVINLTYLDYQNYDLMIEDLLPQSKEQKNYREYEKKK